MEKAFTKKKYTFGNYMVMNKGTKEKIRKSKLKYNFEIPVDDCVYYKFTDFEKNHTRMYKNGKYKHEYDNKTTSLRNCAFHYSKLNNKNYHYISRLEYDESGELDAVKIIRVK